MRADPATPSRACFETRGLASLFGTRRWFAAGRGSGLWLPDPMYAPGKAADGKMLTKTEVLECYFRIT